MISTTYMFEHPGEQMLPGTVANWFDKIKATLKPETVQKIWQFYRDEGLIYELENRTVMLWGAQKRTTTGVYSHGPVAHNIIVGWMRYVLARSLKVADAEELLISGLVHNTNRQEGLEAYKMGQRIKNTGLSKLFGSKVARYAKITGYSAIENVLLHVRHLPTCICFISDEMVAGTEIDDPHKKATRLLLDAQRVDSQYYKTNATGLRLYGRGALEVQRDLARVVEIILAKKLNIRPATQFTSAVISLMG